MSLQFISLLVAALICPASFGLVLVFMEMNCIKNPPKGAYFFLFGGVGTLFLGIASHPSGIAALCSLVGVMIAPLATFFSSIELLRLPERTVFHKVAIWGGFLYPAVVATMVVITGYLSEWK